MRDYLKDGDPDSDVYAARFREDTWAGVLKIVRWHVSDCRPESLPVEGSDDKPPEAEPSTQAAKLADAFCNYPAGLPVVREDKKVARQAAIGGVSNRSRYVAVEAMRRGARRRGDAIGRCRTGQQRSSYPRRWVDGRFGGSRRSEASWG